MFSWVSKQSLGLKFALMVIAILSATTSMVTYIDIRSQHEILVNSLEAKGQVLGNFVSLISPQSILTYDFESMNDYMREVSRDKDIIYGVLVAENGIDLTQFLDEKNDYVINARNTVVNEDDVLEVISAINNNPEIIEQNFPVLFKGRTLGILKIGMSRRHIDENYYETLLNMLLANALIIVFLSIVIYIGFRYMAIQPIGKLQQGLHKVANGDFDSTIAVHSEDEIGTLTTSFNNMVGRLKVSNNELQKRIDESMRIMRDLHDDVGAKLLTLVHRAESSKNEEMARSALKNLRETLRGLGKTDTSIELDDALVTWQAEVGDRLDAANIRLEWEADDYPDIKLNNRQIINLSRILREAVSNSIRHAHPETIKVESTANNGSFTLKIIDDGNNNDPPKWTAGTGLNNMQRRASELDGTINWYAIGNGKTTSGGTCVEVSCPL